MEQKELQRKIVATIAATVTLCVLLAVSVFLLVTTQVFTLEIKILMLACCLVLAIAIGGFLYSKILEIRALRVCMMNDNSKAQNYNDINDESKNELEDASEINEYGDENKQNVANIIESEQTAYIDSINTDPFNVENTEMQSLETLEDFSFENGQESTLQNAPQQNNFTPQQNTVQPQQNNFTPQQNTVQPQQNNFTPQQNTVQPQQNNVIPQQSMPLQPAVNPNLNRENNFEKQSTQGPLNISNTNNFVQQTPYNNVVQQPNTLNTETNAKPAKKKTNYADLFKKQNEKQAAEQAAYRAASLALAKQKMEELKKPKTAENKAPENIMPQNVVRQNEEASNNENKQMSPYAKAKMLYEEKIIKPKYSAEDMEKIKKHNAEVAKSKENATAAVTAANDAATRASEAAARAEARLLALAGLTDDGTTAPKNIDTNDVLQEPTEKNGAWKKDGH